MELLPHQNDEIRSTISEIEKWLARNEMQLVRSELHDKRTIPSAFWDPGQCDWKVFLQAAKKSDNQLIWIELDLCIIPTKEELDELSEHGGEPGLRELESSISTLRDYNGHIAVAFLYWVYRGILNIFVLEPSWIEKFHDLEEILASLRSEIRQSIQVGELEAERDKERHRFEEMAKELSEHTDYIKCSNRGDRIYLAEKLFGSNIASRQVAMKAETLSRMKK